jgi:hypothetical protein
MPVIPGIRRWRQEDCEFKASLGYLGIHYLKKQINKKKKRKKRKERERRVMRAVLWGTWGEGLGGSQAITGRLWQGLGFGMMVAWAMVIEMDLERTRLGPKEGWDRMLSTGWSQLTIDFWGGRDLWPWGSEASWLTEWWSSCQHTQPKGQVLWLTHLILTPSLSLGFLLPPFTLVLISSTSSPSTVTLSLLSKYTRTSMKLRQLEWSFLRKRRQN